MAIPPEPDPALGSPATTDPAGPAAAPGTAPSVDWETDDNPYKQRFNDYRTEADRRATELSQYKQAQQDLNSDDPRVRQAAADFIGIELYDDEQTPFDDPLDELRAEIERLKGGLTQRDEQAATRMIESQLDALGLNDEEKELVFARAIAMPAGPDGLPPIKAAHEALTARDNARLEEAKKAWERDWRKSKLAPSSIQPGVTGTQQPNVDAMTLEQAAAYAAQRLADMEDANAA